MNYGQVFTDEIPPMDTTGVHPLSTVRYAIKIPRLTRALSLLLRGGRYSVGLTLEIETGHEADFEVLVRKPGPEAAATATAENKGVEVRVFSRVHIETPP